MTIKKVKLRNFENEGYIDYGVAITIDDGKENWDRIFGNESEALAFILKKYFGVITETCYTNQETLQEDGHHEYFWGEEL